MPNWQKVAINTFPHLFRLCVDLFELRPREEFEEEEEIPDELRDIPDFKHSSQEVGYCLECGSKHINTAKVLMREAIQRVEAKEPIEKVWEKVRGVAVEIAGMEDDTAAPEDDEIRQLNSEVRHLRREMWTAGIETDRKLTSKDLKPFYGKIDALSGKVYTLAEDRRHRFLNLIEKVEEETAKLKERASKPVGKRTADFLDEKVDVRSPVGKH